jgi:hypothetical protein
MSVIVWGDGGVETLFKFFKRRANIDFIYTVRYIKNFDLSFVRRFN